MLKTLGLAALGLEIADTAKVVSKLRKRETVDLHSHRLRMKELDREMRESAIRHRNEMREIREHAQRADAARQSAHDAEMARLNGIMEENDASFDVMMAAIYDPNLSESEKVAAIKAYQPKFG